MAASDQSTTQSGATESGPDARSSDYKHSASFWRIAQDVLDGVEAMRHVQAGGELGQSAIQFTNVTQQLFAQGRGLEPQSPYLPKFPNEPYDEYDRRRRKAFLTNIYADISGNLSGKPFAKTLELAPDTGDDLKKLADDIDGLGNNLHVFARDAFKAAIDKGLTWIMADFTKVPSGATLAAERDLGARPYWVHVPVEKLIAVYSKFLNGREIIFNARIHEPTTELDGYDEVVINRVRELNRNPILDDQGGIIGFEPATWTVYEEDETEEFDAKTSTNVKVSSWDIVDEGDITVGIIPLIPIIIGKRDGTSWRVQPPLRDLVYMQVKLFQMESNLDYTKELTAFPMLAGDGVSSTDDKGVAVRVPVGPRAVLFAPMAGDGRHGQWHFIEPGGSSLKFLQDDIDKHKTEMRDLGMQPLTSANLTVITTANVAMKAHSAVQAWALGLKDALEQAWKINCLWLKRADDEVVVDVHTDFGVDMEAGTELVALTGAEAAGIISKKLTFNEFKRRGVLADDADFEEDQAEVARHQANDILQPERQIDPITGMPIIVKPKPGVLNPPPKPPAKPGFPAKMN